MSDKVSVFTPGFIQPNQANQGATANNMFAAMSIGGNFGEREDGHSGLTWGGYGVDRIYLNGAIVTKANWTQAITQSATRFLSIDRSMALTQQATVFKTTDFPLFEITTSTTGVTDFKDHRDVHNYNRWAYSRLTKAMADANQTLTCVESFCESIECTGTLTALRDLIIPAVVRSYTVYANVTGSGVRVISTSGTGVTVSPGAVAQVEFDGTNVRSIGGGGGTAGRHAIWISAASMRPSATGGCAALSVIATSANRPDLLSLDFDATTQEYAQFSIRMPKSWNEGTITYVPGWSHANTATNFGVVWDLQAVAVSNDDQIVQDYGTAQTSADTGGTTDDLYVGPESSAITVGGTPAAEDLVFFRVSRVTGNGGDTMAIDARLHGITVYITTDADTDA